MSAEADKVKIVQEWVERAMHDLQSAELILHKSESFEIAAYHSHQAIEKLLKAELIKKGESFRFIHDLIALFNQVSTSGQMDDLFKKLSFVNLLYPSLRYPAGDKITREQAEKCLAIAKEVAARLSY